MRRFDDAVLLIEVQRRYGYLVRALVERAAEIGPVALSLQLSIGNQPDRTIRSGMVDTEDFAAAIRDADDAKLRIGGLGLQFGQQPLRHPPLPSLFGQAVNGIDAAGKTCADQPVQCRRRSEAGDVAARAADIGLQIESDEPRMRLGPVEDARQDRLLQAAIVQPADRGNRDRDQRNHRDGKPGCERHVRFRPPSHPPPGKPRS